MKKGGLSTRVFNEDLSPKTNVIVGKNGSGKSNFFAAIQFVLSEKYSALSATERKEIFHVGSGRPALSIFVELVFDNSDGRLVVPGRAEEKEVRIRRTVGLKQDEFRVNDRKFTSTEVRQLLESAGFSSSNPYYIVEQGKIASLVNMSDEDRYQLIKDVAGTSVYEARRKESEEILMDTSSKQKKIEESILQITERLKELESETAEFKVFQETDKERKCIEYCIFSLEVDNAKDCLVKLDEKRDAYLTFINKEKDTENTTKSEIANTGAQIRSCAKRIFMVDTEIQSLEKERAVLTSKKAIAQIDADDATSVIHRNDKERISLTKECERLEKEASKQKTDLDTKQENLQRVQMLAERKSEELSATEKKLESLLARRGRQRLFKNKTERDSWLTKEINRNRDIIENYKRELASVNKNISDVVAFIQDEENLRKEKEAQTKTVESKLVSQESRRARCITKRNELNMERRCLWQKVNDQESVVQKIHDECERVHNQHERSIRHDIRQGLQSLKEILSEISDERVHKAVHGQLIELIKVDQGYEIAVEVTAGNALFNVVVDSFEISAFLLEQINRRKKPGRISFFPLDTCNGEAKQFTQTEGCTMLLDHISFNPIFAGVVAEVFGRTAVVSSIEIGAKTVKQYNVDAVTMDGDQLSRKGGITGGFLESRNLRIITHRNEKLASEKLLKEKKILDDLCQSVAVVEQQITEAINEIESLNGEFYIAENEADIDLRDARLYMERKNRHENQKEQLQATRKSLEKTLAEAANSLDILQQEAKDDFKITWGVNEENQLESIMSQVDKERENSTVLQLEVVQLSTEVRLVEDTLQNINRRMGIVRDRIRELGWASTSNETLAKERSNVDEDLALVSKRLVVLKQTLNEITKEKHKFEEYLEPLKTKQMISSRSAQERSDNDERIQVQRSLIIQRRDEALEKIRKLGVIPKGAEKYSGQSLSVLMHRLKENNENMKRFAHVNRKAVDQYTSLMETKNELTGQKESLESELQSIHELMQHLDRKKEEVVERTYKQIQYQFEEVFKALVSTEDCHAELLLIRSSTKNESRDDPYVAARIRVSFGLGAVVTELAQLSGGQKSLVALALIFAIQRCDPAPFYLFDEIDAALDAEYRSSVAKLLVKESENSQFITATFKTEMLEASERVLGVFFHNKVSRIQTISLDEGVMLLKQAAIEGKKRARDADGDL